jgi:translation initiation factor 1 (eIF-1/SUI1)
VTLTPGPAPTQEQARVAVEVDSVDTSPAASTRPDGQASADSEPVSGLGAQLKAKLVAAGWVTHTDADGTVTLTQQVDEMVTVDVSKVADTHDKPAESVPPAAEPPSLADDLKARLGAAGWVTHTEVDGSVTLTQPVAAAPAVAVSEMVEVADEPAAPAAAELPSLADDLQARLGAAGWVTHTEADGSVTLTQPVAEVPPVDVLEVVEVADEPTALAAAEPPSLADDLKARLGAAGWVTHTDADGSVTLTQPVAEAPAVAVPEVVEVAEEPAVPAAAEPPSLAADLKARLGAAGWVTRTEEDGSLILTQSVDVQPTELPNDAFTVCPGTSPRDNGALPAAPIDTWAKARQVARAWRDQHLPDTVVVGLIRELPRLYIASLVSNDQARDLKHLLAIRKRSGEVLVID